MTRNFFCRKFSDFIFLFFLYAYDITPGFLTPLIDWSFLASGSFVAVVPNRMVPTLGFPLKVHWEEMTKDQRLCEEVERVVTYCRGSLTMI